MEEQDLRRWYIDEGLSYAKIGEKLGCTAGNVSYWLGKFGIKKPRSLSSSDPLVQWLYDNCFTAVEKLNNRCCIPTWWKTKGRSIKLQEIVDRTNWLDTDNISQRIYHIINNRNSVGHCGICRKTTEFGQFQSGYREYCSVKCATQSADRNQRISQKNQANKQERIGKSRTTNLQRYGVENFYESEEFKIKSKKTKLERYGDEYYNNQDKRKETCIERYGVDHPDKTLTKHVDRKDVLKLHFEEKKTCVEIAEMYGVSFTTITRWIHEEGFTPLSNLTSAAHSKLFEYIKTLCPDAIINDRTVIKPKELDIYIPSRNLAVEVNGIYWHSEKRGADRNHLLDKTRMAIEAGVELLHFYDLQIDQKFDLVCSIVSGKLGCNKRLHARKCKIQHVPNEVYRDFLENNHLQGYCGAKSKYGLFFEGQLVSVMSFGQNRFRNGEELLRFCNLMGTNVIGGAGKLFKHHLLNSSASEIVSYCDRAVFDGKMYQSLGFEKVKENLPGYYYWKNNSDVLLSRMQFQKHKLPNLLETFDESLTEHENMKNNGFTRVWDCGQLVFEYRR